MWVPQVCHAGGLCAVEVRYETAGRETQAHIFIQARLIAYDYSKELWLPRDGWVLMSLWSYFREWIKWPEGQSFLIRQRTDGMFGALYVDLINFLAAFSKLKTWLKTV